MSSRNEPSPISIASRVSAIYGTTVFSQSAVGGNFRDSFGIAGSEFEDVLVALQQVAKDVDTFEATLEDKGAPWTPGRIPTWSGDQ